MNELAQTIVVAVTAIIIVVVMSAALLLGQHTGATECGGSRNGPTHFELLMENWE